LQFRVEAYNVLNTLQFKDVDKGARFDPAGNQVNANFGKAITAPQSAHHAGVGAIQFLNHYAHTE
jgi:hypothetical protein